MLSLWFINEKKLNIINKHVLKINLKNVLVLVKF